MTVWDFFDKHEFIAFVAVLCAGIALVTLAESIGMFGRNK